MTRRLPHGGTTRPQYTRPGNGYGRRVKPGPPSEWRLPDAFRTDWIELLVRVATEDSETAKA